MLPAPNVHMRYVIPQRHIKRMQVVILTARTTHLPLNAWTQLTSQNVRLLLETALTTSASLMQVKLLNSARLHIARITHLPNNAWAQLKSQNVKQVGKTAIKVFAAILPTKLKITARLTNVIKKNQTALSICALVKQVILNTAGLHIARKQTHPPLIAWIQKRSIIVRQKLLINVPKLFVIILNTKIRPIARHSNVMLWNRTALTKSASLIQEKVPNTV